MCIPESVPGLRALAELVSNRLTKAYKPKTWTTYKSMFITFMTFCEIMATDPIDPSPFIIMAFIELLAHNNLAFPSIANFITAIRSQAKWLNIPMNNLDHPRVHLMMKAVKNSVSKPPKFKSVFDIPTLHSILLACEYFPDSSVFIAIYLLAFFGFFRISNLVPTSKLSFNTKLHLCRGDVIFHEDIAIVLIKWSKTLQNPDQGSYIIIPSLGLSPLCPVTAIKNMIKNYPIQENQPMFVNVNGVITQSQLRSHLRKVLLQINVDPSVHSFHTFRRSGATLAFNSGVDISHIKRHGTWLSDAVHTYIVSDPQNASAVSRTFANLLST